MKRKKRIIGKKANSNLGAYWEAQSVSHIIFFNSNFKKSRVKNVARTVIEFYYGCSQ